MVCFVVLAIHNSLQWLSYVTASALLTWTQRRSQWWTPHTKCTRSSCRCSRHMRRLPTANFCMSLSQWSANTTLQKSLQFHQACAALCQWNPVADEVVSTVFAREVDHLTIHRASIHAPGRQGLFTSNWLAMTHSPLYWNQWRLCSTQFVSCNSSGAQEPSFVFHIKYSMYITL